MTEIEYKGANGLVIKTARARLVIDPKISVVGLKDIDTKDSIEIATEPRFLINDPSRILMLNLPGEYGIADVDITGIEADRHIDEPGTKGETIYRIEVADGLVIGVLGNVASKFTEDQLEQLGMLNILIIPVGGNGYTLDAIDAAKLVHSISPKVVIPTSYADSAIKYEVPQDSLDAFLKAMNVTDHDTTSKYKIKQPTALPDNTSVVEITRS